MHETLNEVAGRQSRGTWTCTCSTDGLPKVAAGSQDTTCFTACNCTFGTSFLLTPDIMFPFNS
jgi:phage/plasmid primase-like uncharacterized protein